MSISLTEAERQIALAFDDDDARYDAFFNGVIGALLERLPETKVVALENHLLSLPSAQRREVVRRAITDGAPLPLPVKKFGPANRAT